MEDWDGSPESTPLKRTRHVKQPTDSEGAGPSSLPPSKKKRLSLSKPKQRWEFLDECAQGALTKKFSPKNTNASTKWVMSYFSECRKSWNTCVVARAYRAAEGGERACNARSPLVDGEIQHVTKNNTSSHARECWFTDRKRMDTEEYGRLRAGARE